MRLTRYENEQGVWLKADEVRAVLHEMVKDLKEIEQTMKWFAASNPKWKMPQGEMQDPNGVHQNLAVLQRLLTRVQEIAP